MTTTSFSPASMAFRAEESTTGGGTMTREALSSGWAATAWAAVSYTGTPHTSCPPLPGETPASTCTPYSSIFWVW